MPTISFIIPVYNEAKRIHKTMEALNTLTLPRGLRLQEVIFVNDGSEDETGKLLQRAKTTVLRRFTKRFPKTKYTIISFRENRGKGCAIRYGMEKASADYTLFFDADMSTPLSEIKKFLPYIKNETDVIIGTRKNGKSTVLMHQPLIRELLGKAFTKTATTILQVQTTDFTCGFKAFSKKAKDTIFPQTLIDRWGYDAEIIYLALKHKLSLQEKAVSWSHDEGTKVRMLEAVLQTLFDLAVIKWYHSLLPKMQQMKIQTKEQLLHAPLASRIASRLF